MNTIRFKQSALALALCAAAATPLQAQGDLDFSVSDDTAKLQFSSFVPYNNLSWSAEYLHFESGDFDANIFGGGFFVAGRSNATSGRQTAGIGGKFLVLDADLAESGSGVAVGGFIRHTFSQANLISIRGEAYVAPGIMSFQGLDNYLEVSARIEYQLLDQANVYLGYRSIEADMEMDAGGEGKYEFEDGLMAGVNLRF